MIVYLDVTMVERIRRNGEEKRREKKRKEWNGQEEEGEGKRNAKRRIRE